MRYHMPLSEMTTADKLEAMEKLWEDLCRNTEALPSPAWHENVLSSREKTGPRRQSKRFQLSLILRIESENHPNEN